MSVGCSGVICYVSSLGAVDVHEFPVLHEGYSANDAKDLCLCCGDVDGFSLVMTINKKGAKKMAKEQSFVIYKKKMIFVFYDS